MKTSIKIGTLLSAIQNFKKIELNLNEEIEVSDLGIKIKKPSLEYTPIRFVIKKRDMGIALTFNNNKLVCARKHILYDKNFLPIHAEMLKNNDMIRTFHGFKKIDSVDLLPEQDFYDLTIDAPHVYVDSNGIIHHNSLITAVLSKKIEKYGRSIVIVPSKDLITQTEAYYKILGLDVGVFYGDRKEYFKKHTICTWQSLEQLRKAPIDIGVGEPITIKEFINEVVAVIIDECHMAKATVLSSLLTKEFSHIPIRWAVTGTVPKEPFEMINLTISIGDVIHKLATSELQELGILSNCDVKIIQMIDFREFTSYSAEYDYLVTDHNRLEYVAKLIENASNTGNILVLVGRKETGKTLAELIDGSVFLSGATKSSTRREHYDEVAISNSKVIIATAGIAAIGIDIPRLNHLMIFEGGKSYIRTVQSVGRSLRTSFDKNHAIIWDICSSCKFSKRHLTNRKKWYADQKFPFVVEKIDWQNVK
jgi:superfamily II DNA or RNA helicase